MYSYQSYITALWSTAFDVTMRLNHTQNCMSRSVIFHKWISVNFLPPTSLNWTHCNETVYVANVLSPQSSPTKHLRRPGWRYSSYSFSTSALDGDEWSASRPGERTPVTHWTGGWMAPRAGLDTDVRGISSVSTPTHNFPHCKWHTNNVKLHYCPVAKHVAIFQKLFDDTQVY
jgi:hypothetical protein